MWIIRSVHIKPSTIYCKSSIHLKKTVKRSRNLLIGGTKGKLFLKWGPLLSPHLNMIFCNDNLCSVIALKKIHKILYFSEIKLEISLNYWEQIVKRNFLIWIFYMAFTIFIFFSPNYWIFNKLLMNVS